MAEKEQVEGEPKDPPEVGQEPKDPPEGGKDPKGGQGSKDPEQYLEELRKQAGQDGSEGDDGSGGADDHARLVEALKEQELTKARLEAVSQAYVDLLKQGGTGSHTEPQDFDDIIKQSRKAGGTYYGGKE